MRPKPPSSPRFLLCCIPFYGHENQDCHNRHENHDHDDHDERHDYDHDHRSHHHYHRHCHLPPQSRPRLPASSSSDIAPSSGLDDGECPRDRAPTAKRVPTGQTAHGTEIACGAAAFTSHRRLCRPFARRSAPARCSSADSAVYSDTSPSAVAVAREREGEMS